MLQTLSEHIKDNYGSKRGLLDLYLSKCKGLLGYWEQYKNIDWKIVDSLVFICMGNICRSPLAEAVAHKEGIATRSFGLTAPAGDPADPRAIILSRRYNYDLSQHQTTPIKSAIFKTSDLIVVMEPQHLIFKNFPKNIAGQITLLGLWHEKTIPYLHDPYNTNENYFTNCELTVIQATKNIIQKLKISKI